MKHKFFRGMEEHGCLPNYCCCNVTIQGFLKHDESKKHQKLLMKCLVCDSLQLSPLQHF
uniref:Uncharacterized protein n=1 Tax=Manihot esculenta TaxID=3983 RepID=A0A199UCD8_MANES